MFGFSGVPKHCLACDGSEISRATYSELFEVFGETFGAGDGETTFTLPDFRGYFLRGAGGAAAAIGTAQGDAIRNITGDIGVKAVADDTTGWLPIGGVNGAFVPGTVTQGRAIADSSILGPFTDFPVNAAFSAALVVPTAAENRPINFAVNICVVYE